MNMAIFMTRPWLFFLRVAPHPAYASIAPAVATMSAAATGSAANEPDATASPMELQGESSVRWEASVGPPPCVLFQGSLASLVTKSDRAWGGRLRVWVVVCGINRLFFFGRGPPSGDYRPHCDPHLLLPPSPTTTRPQAPPLWPTRRRSCSWSSTASGAGAGPKRPSARVETRSRSLTSA